MICPVLFPTLTLYMSSLTVSASACYENLEKTSVDHVMTLVSLVFINLQINLVEEQQKVCIFY